MAARTGAAALSSPVWCSFLLLLCVFLNVCNAAISYSRQNLIDLGFKYSLSVSGDYQRTHNILEEIARPPGSPWMVCPPSKRRRRRRERKQKRGCRSGSDARLRKQPHRPALPSLFVSNARSITHKLDELELQIATTSFARNCSIILITESWLHPLIPDAAVELAGRTLHRHDRTSNSVLPKPEVSQVTSPSGITEANCTAKSRPAAEITWNVGSDNRTLGPPFSSAYEQGDGTTIVTSTLLFQSGLFSDLSIKCIVHHPGLNKPLMMSLNTNMGPAMVILISVCGVAAVLLLCLCVCLCKCFICTDD